MQKEGIVEVLTEESVVDFIKEGRVVIRTWDEGCGYCTKYEPIFNEYIAETGVKAGVLRLYIMKEKKPSAFKRAYMKQDASDQIKETVPGTFVFENGELVARHFGAMSKEQLAKLVSDFKAPEAQQPMSIEDFCKRATITELKASAYEAIMAIEQSRNNLNIFQQALLAKQQLQKAPMPKG
jgi:thioredoxin-like negative regulator of GroEL